MVVKEENQEEEEEMIKEIELIKEDREIGEQK